MATTLSKRIEQYLPAGIVDFLRWVGQMADEGGQKVYLVGGAVRDLFLGQASLDIDVVVEGDAIKLAQEIVENYRGKLTIHPQFGTANLRWKKWSIDLATARSETYFRPGALPTVRSGTMTDDLFRRDSTINAMAICLIPDCYGQLLDPYGGKDDLKHRLIRILHEKSFIDDATRIWRALRYEQRLDFQMESRTLQLLKRDIPMLDTISPDRIRYEVECILKEKYPEKVLRRADQLGVLATITLSLTGNGWLADKFEEARQQTAPALPSVELYLALMAYRFKEDELKNIIVRLRLSRSIVRTLRDMVILKYQFDDLADPALTPTGVYHQWQGRSELAMLAITIACDVTPVKERIRFFLDSLRHVKPLLNGEDIKQMGITSGPDIGAILDKLLEAKLDGKVNSRDDEESLVRSWLASGMFGHI